MATTLISKDVKLKYVSKSRPKSLILRIPAIIRDLLELTYDDTITMDVVIEDEVKCIKIYKKTNWWLERLLLLSTCKNCLATSDTYLRVTINLLSTIIRYTIICLTNVLRYYFCKMFILYLSPFFYVFFYGGIEND